MLGFRDNYKNILAALWRRASDLCHGRSMQVGRRLSFPAICLRRHYQTFPGTIKRYLSLNLDWSFIKTAEPERFGWIFTAKAMQFTRRKFQAPNCYAVAATEQGSVRANVETD